MTFDSKIWLSNSSVSPGIAYNFTIDLAAKRCTRTQIDRASVEFPSSHPYRNGMAGTRFNYFMACDRPGFNLPYRDVVKVRGTMLPWILLFKPGELNSALVTHARGGGEVTFERGLPYKSDGYWLYFLGVKIRVVVPPMRFKSNINHF